MIHMGFQGLESLYFHTPMDHSGLGDRLSFRVAMGDLLMGSTAKRVLTSD